MRNSTSEPTADERRAAAAAELAAAAAAVVRSALGKLATTSDADLPSRRDAMWERLRARQPRELSDVTQSTRQLSLYYAAHARRVDLDRMWRASLPKWEKLLRSLAPHVLKMAVAPADRRGFLADVVLYVHVCFRAARARRKRSAGGKKRIDHRTADPERSGLKDELESRGIQYSSKEGTAALRRKLENGA